MQINDTVHIVKTTGPYTFKIGDTRALGTYTTGGLFKQVKMPKLVDFQSLKEQLANPTLFIADYSKFDRPQQLHICFQALEEFKAETGRFPLPRNEADATAFCARVHKMAGDLDLNDDIIKEFAFGAQGDVPAMNGVLGGLIAQEVLKACSGKFMPVHQFLYFDSVESLPEVRPTEQQCKPQGTRYDSQIAVFGSEFMKKISNQRQFLVGAGAIGCEMLKNWAMMGLGTGPNGSLAVTDMDTIEKSNLNRQFLFRPSDVSHLKSECAAAAVAKMNPDTKGKIRVFCDRVGVETEHIFNDMFWDGLDGVTNALDNVAARQYVDRRCVFYCKPLLESGTLGTKGNTQVVVPSLTESYSSSNDPPEKSIPICTLKNFPNAIEHTIQWARDLFEGLFTQSSENVNLYLAQSNYVDSLLKQGGNHMDTLLTIHSFLVKDRSETFEDCVIWARMQFQELYFNSISQLLYNFPVDSLTTSGAAFWSGPKRAPAPIVFKKDDVIDPLT